jgi:very-short-patch-repair endonuclease
MTPAEQMLWRALRGGRLQGLKFRRQHGVGQYVLDFYCAAARLAVEVDGSVHDDPEQAVRDELRTEQLNAYGRSVLRFRNDEVFRDLDSVLTRIAEAAAHRLNPTIAEAPPRPALGEGAGG